LSVSETIAPATGLPVESRTVPLMRAGRCAAGRKAERERQAGGGQAAAAAGLNVLHVFSSCDRK
jgi:hypothetical protein